MKRSNFFLPGYVLLVLLATPLVTLANHGGLGGTSVGHVGAALLAGLAIGVVARLAARLLH